MYCYKAHRLLPDWILYIKCIPGCLHMRLRIGGRLIKLFIKDLCDLDNYNGKEFITIKHKNLNSWYYTFLRQTCKIGAKLIKFIKEND